MFAVAQGERNRQRRMALYALFVGIALAAGGVAWKVQQVCGLPGRQVCEGVPPAMAALPVVLMVAGALLIMGAAALLLAFRLAEG